MRRIADPAVPERTRRTWLGELGAVAGLYAALALVATWPLALHFSDHVPAWQWWGSRKIHPESLLNLWNLWWFRHALIELGQDPFRCQFLLHPFGVNLWHHTLAPLHGLVALPLLAFLSLAAAQNSLLLLGLIAAGVCTFALARQLGLERAGARLAGAIYAFSPVAFAHLYAGHFELMATYWLPAMLLVWLRLASEPAARLRHAVGLGLLFVAAAYSSQYYCVYGVELLGVAAAVDARRVWRPAMLRALAVAAVITLVGIAPLLWAFLGERGPRPDESAQLVDFGLYSVDLIGFAVPSFTHPLLSAPLHDLYERLHPGLFTPQETTAYVGFSVIGLVILGCLRGPLAPRPLRLSLAVALGFWVLSLGSQLKLYGTETGIPLPTLLLGQLPLVRFARAPGRHMVVAMLGFGLLAGAGWQRLRRHWVRWPVLALLAFEYAALPLPLLSTQVAAAYRRLAEVPGSFAVLDVPPGVRDGQSGVGWFDNGQIFAQTVHGHPIVSAAVSRLPPEKWQAVLAAPVIGTLLQPQRMSKEVFLRDRSEGASFFARFGIDAVVVHPSAPDEPYQRYVEGVLPIRRRERFDDGSQLWWLREP